MKRILLIAPLFSLALVACPAHRLDAIPFVQIVNLADGDDESRNCVGGIEGKLSFVKGADRHELSAKVAFGKTDGPNIPAEWVLAGTELTVEAKCLGLDGKLLFSSLRKGVIPFNFDPKSTFLYGLGIQSVHSIKSKDIIEKFKCYDQFDSKKIGLCIIDTEVYGLTTPTK
jgi:hypothetical protein